MSLRTTFQATITKIRSFKRKSLLELMALVSMALALVGASRIILWEWWPFAVMASMFFIAGNLHLLRSFSIGPSGLKAEMRETADSPAVDTKETWKERDRLELYVLANISVKNEPHQLPIIRDPALSRLRLLKDVARDGQLSYQGDSPNAFATVRFEDFARYAEGTDVDAFRKLAEQWRAAHKAEPRRAEIAPRDEARLRLARLRTAGVHLRNRKLDIDEVAVWIPEVRDWTLAVAAEIEKIDAADAEWFRTLDAVPPPRVNFNDLSPEYSKTFRELDFMLVKLERLMTNYSSALTRNENAASAV